MRARVQTHLLHRRSARACARARRYTPSSTGGVSPRGDYSRTGPLSAPLLPFSPLVLFSLRSPAKPHLQPRRPPNEVAAVLVQAGFAKAVHEPDDLLPAAYAIAKKIVKHSPVAIALTRQMMYRNSAQEHPRDAHNVDSLSIFYSSLGSGKEGVRSFLEKREAVFSDSAREMPPFYPWWKS